MSKPAVLFVIMQPAAVGADGGTASISQVMERLKRHRPIVVTDRDGSRVSRWRELGIECHVIPQVASRGFLRNPLGTAASYWRYARRLSRLVKSSGARVIHANDPAAFQLALWPARRTGSRIVLNLRDTIDPGRRPPRKRYRFLFAAADQVLFLSNDMAKRWTKIAPNATRQSSVTYSIVDFDRFRPAPVPPATDPPVVLLSGLIRRKKGQLDFLRHVAPTLACQGIETWLAGDFDPARDPYARECAEAAAPLGERVRFLGYRTDVPELMARSTLIAVASRHEGLVRAMIEAMSCARPVVSFDVCSAREILEEQSPGAGAVVRSGDFAGMAQAIIGYCEHPEAAARAGEAGLNAALRLFDADEVVARYEAAYDGSG